MRILYFNSATRFLIGTLVGCMLMVGGTLAFSTPTQAASISDADIEHQETVVRAEARETVEAYLRLILYGLIQKLEMRVEAQ